MFCSQMASVSADAIPLTVDIAERLIAATVDLEPIAIFPHPTVLPDDEPSPGPPLAGSQPYTKGGARSPASERCRSLPIVVGCHKEAWASKLSALRRL